MGLKLRVNTKNMNEKSLLGLEEELEQPLSPTSEYLTSLVSTFYVLCFLELEIPVDFSATVAFFNEVFINSHPRLSSIVVENRLGRKLWKKVTVNAADHMKVPCFVEGSSLENFSEEYDNYISKIATSPLPPNKPLWDLHIINCPKGYHVPAIVIFKFHHSIGDGTSLMAAVLSCAKRVDDPSLPLIFPSQKKTTSEIEHSATRNEWLNIINIVPNIISSIVYSMCDFGQSVRLICSKDSLTPVKSGYTDMTLPFSARVCSVILSLIDVKRIKALLGVTVNDVIVGIIFLGTRLYIQEKDQGQLKNARSTASIAINMRSVKGNISLDEMHKEKSWGNRISTIELPLPKLEDEDLTNPLKFIHKIHKIIKRKKDGNYGPLIMAKLLDVIKTFAGLQTAAWTLERKWRNGSFAITNVIGPTQQVSIANHPIKGFYFAPTGANLSLTVSVMSYMDELRLGLVIENGFIDPQKLITCMENAFQLIFQAAKATPSYVAEK